MMKYYLFNTTIMLKKPLNVPVAYVPPVCESVGFRSTGILCASETFSIDDLNTNDWGDFGTNGGDF